MMKFNIFVWFWHPHLDYSSCCSGHMLAWGLQGGTRDRTKHRSNITWAMIQRCKHLQAVPSWQPTCSSCASLSWCLRLDSAPWWGSPTPCMFAHSVFETRCLCSTVPDPHSSLRFLLKQSEGIVTNEKEMNGMWFAVELLTFFTIGSLKTVSAQTKHVFTRGQGEDGVAPIETDLTCRTKERLHKQWTGVDVLKRHEWVLPERPEDEDQDEEDIGEEKMKKFFCLLPPKMSWKKN